MQNDFDIKMTRTLESEVQSMCNLSKGIEEKGRQEGRQEGIQEGIQEEEDRKDWLKGFLFL